MFYIVFLPRLFTLCFYSVFLFRFLHPIISSAKQKLLKYMDGEADAARYRYIISLTLVRPRRLAVGRDASATSVIPLLVDRFHGLDA